MRWPCTVLAAVDWMNISRNPRKMTSGATMLAPDLPDTLRRTRLLLHAETKFATRDASIHRVIAKAGEVILGKERQIRMAVACLLARGHLLIEDLPGVGKTTLAHTLAKLLGLAFQRISFTSDLLPADIIGVSVFDRHTSSFKFHPGPIFSQLILADEVNRAT